MPIVGSFAGASARAYGLGAGVKLSITGFNSIASTLVGSGGASNIEFLAIPSTYTHLQLRILSFASTADTDVNIQFNTDTASNYAWHRFASLQTSVYADAGLTQSFGIVGRTGSGSDMFGVSICDIVDYKNTNKFKTTRGFFGRNSNGTGNVWFGSSLWRSTSAISSIKIYPASGTFSQYTRASLYGIEG
jgi:hypothetical protein